METVSAQTVWLAGGSQLEQPTALLPGAGLDRVRLTSEGAEVRLRHRIWLDDRGSSLGPRYN